MGVAVPSRLFSEVCTSSCCPRLAVLRVSGKTRRARGRAANAKKATARFGNRNGYLRERVKGLHVQTGWNEKDGARNVIKLLQNVNMFDTWIRVKYLDPQRQPVEIECLCPGIVNGRMSQMVTVRHQSCMHTNSASSTSTSEFGEILTPSTVPPAAEVTAQRTLCFIFRPQIPTIPKPLLLVVAGYKCGLAADDQPNEIDTQGTGSPSVGYASSRSYLAKNPVDEKLDG